MYSLKEQDKTLVLEATQEGDRKDSSLSAFWKDGRKQ